MAKTFKNIYGQTAEIIDYETSVETNEDIVTGEISQWFVTVGDMKYEVDEDVYTAVKEHIEA